jgi:hypothetical protein
MGEIRVKVLLTNSVDEALYRRKKLKKSAIRRYEADAMVDSGEVRSIIPAHVMEALGLMSRGTRVAEYADGRTEVVAVTEPIVFAVMGRDTLEEALVLGDEVLIGQTVLGKLDLLADCANRRLVASPAHPDQPVSKVKCPIAIHHSCYPANKFVPFSVLRSHCIFTRSGQQAGKHTHLIPHVLERAVIAVASSIHVPP